MAAVMPRPTPQRVVMPFARGLGADADARIRPAEHLLGAVNCYHDADGLLVKRNGFTKFATRLDQAGTAIDAEGPIRGLARTDTELLALGHRTLYAWSPEAGRWISRGRISPCVGKTYERLRGASQYRQADMSVGTKYIVTAGARKRLVFAGSLHEYSIEIEVRSVNTGEVVYTEQLLTTSTATQFPLMPRLFVVPQTGGGGDKHYLLVCYDEQTPSTLKLYSYDEDTPFTAFAFVANITTDLYIENANTEARTFDGLAFNGAGNYAVAYIDNTNNAINMETFDDTDSSVATATITPSNLEVNDYVRVAIADGSTKLYVIGIFNNNVSNIPEVHASGRTTSLTDDWGSITTLDTLDASSYGDNVACRLLPDDGGTNVVVYTWCHADSHINNGATVHFRAASCTTNTSGTIVDAVAEVPNMCPVGRPFGYRNRVYQHMQYNVGFETAGAASPVTSNAIGYCYHALADLAIGEATRQPIKMAALWDVGLAVPANTLLRMGSCSGTHVLADGVTFVSMYPLIAEAVPGEQTADIRVGCDEVRWEFDAAVLATPVYPGCCVIGGGYVAWYDGVQTSELHLPAPPHIDNLVEATGTLAAGTYTYSAVLERTDAAGVLHRSPPSAPQGIAVTGGSDAVEVEARTVQLTHHPRRHLGVRIYRSDVTTPTYTRACFSNTFGKNNELVDYCTMFSDGGLAGTNVAQLYTTGGVLESVSPEGAQLPIVARDRLWMARFFRRSRTQFSQLLSPSSAGETAVAPQMMELLGRIVPSGEDILGLGRTDDSTVLFGKETIYTISGTGPNAVGGNDDMSRAIEVPADAGCKEPRSVVTFPGGVMYRASRCFYTFGRDHQVRDTGNRKEVRTLTDAYPIVTSAVAVPELQHLRFTCTTTAGGSGRIVVFDYGNGEFYEWNVLANGAATTAFVGGVYLRRPSEASGTYYVIESNGQCWQESTEFVDDTTQFIEMDVWSGWVQPAGAMSWHRFSGVSPLGERREAAKLNLRVYVDYDDSAAVSDLTWTEAEIAALPAPTKRLGDLQRIPNIQQAQAMSFRLTDVEGTLADSEGFAFAGLGLDVTAMGGAPKNTRVGQT